MESVTNNEHGDDDDDDDENEVTQEEVVTGAMVSITGSRIKTPNAYPCSDCHQEFSTKKALSRHAAKHSKELAKLEPSDPMDIGTDYAATEDAASGAADVSVDLDESESSLKICSQSNEQEDELEKDKKAFDRQPLKIKLELPKPKTSPIGVRLTCEQCGTQTLKQHMTRHMLTHSGVKPYSCEHCTLAFSRKDKLKEHMKKHQEASPTSLGGKSARAAKAPKVNKCRRCDFTTADKQLFKEHRLTHPTKMIYK